MIKRLNAIGTSTFRRSRVNAAQLMFVLCASALGFIETTHADPLAPSLLSVEEHQDHSLTVLWQTPIKPPASNSLPLQVVLPKNCEPMPDQLRPSIEGNTMRRYVWVSQCKGAMTGQQLGVNPITSRSAATLLQVVRTDGEKYTRFLTPEQPTLTVPERQTSAQVFANYFNFGLLHLAVGLDHILFLLSLVLLNGLNRSLIAVVTLFTVAHSITLALTTLGFIRFPVSLTEAIIALSISYSCALYIKGQQDSLLVKSPVIHIRGMAFGFGLLHGLGFASVLSEIGLPTNEVPLSLLAFNLGIEIGQLLLIAIVWGAIRITRGIRPLRATYDWGERIAQGLVGIAFIAGTVGAYWFWERLIFTVLI